MRDKEWNGKDAVREKGGKEEVILCTRFVRIVTAVGREEWSGRMIIAGEY